MSDDTTPEPNPVDADGNHTPDKGDGTIPGRYNTLLITSIATGEMVTAVAQAQAAVGLSKLLTRFIHSLRMHSDTAHASPEQHRFYREMMDTLAAGVDLYHSQVDSMHDFADRMRHTSRVVDASWDKIDEGSNPDDDLWAALAPPDPEELNKAEQLRDAVKANIERIFGDLAEGADVTVTEIPVKRHRR